MSAQPQGARRGRVAPYDQRGAKTIALWSAWAVASAAVVISLYRQAGVFEFIEKDITRITWIIVGMFLLGVVLNLWQAVRLTAEWSAMYRLERAMRRHGLAAVRVRERPRRIVERVLRDVQRVLKEGGALDLPMLLDTALSAEARRSEFVAFLGNLLITLGLIGTVFGMTLTMSGLSGALGSIGENNQALLEGLKRAMGGMGVAFYTTLVGAVLGGVILRVFAWITGSSAESLKDFLLQSMLVFGSVEIADGPAREVRALDRELARIEARLEKLKLAFSASQEEMRKLAETLEVLTRAAKEAADDQALHRIAVAHAKYALAMRRPRLFRRFFGRSLDEQGR